MLIHETTLTRNDGGDGGNTVRTLTRSARPDSRPGAAAIFGQVVADYFRGCIRSLDSFKPTGYSSVCRVRLGNAIPRTRNLVDF